MTEFTHADNFIDSKWNITLWKRKLILISRMLKYACGWVNFWALEYDCVHYFSHNCDKIFDWNKWNEEEFIWAHVLRGWPSIMLEKHGYSNGRKMWLLISSQVREQRMRPKAELVYHPQVSPTLPYAHHPKVPQLPKTELPARDKCKNPWEAFHMQTTTMTHFDLLLDLTP